MLGALQIHLIPFSQLPGRDDYAHLSAVAQKSEVNERTNLEHTVTQSPPPSLIPKNQALLCGGPKESQVGQRTVPRVSTLGARAVEAGSACSEGSWKDTESMCGVVGPMQGLLPPPSGLIFPFAK